jgi:hypothetical protein
MPGPRSDVRVEKAADPMIQGTLPPVACLEPEVLGALAEGRLAGAERDAAVRHLATCRRCHEIFASSVQILEGEGVLPVVRDAAPTPVPRPMVWLSAAAAALVSAVLFVQRAPVVVPRIAEASPTPVATASPVATVTPSPSAVQTASLPPEAVEALRLLDGFESPYAVPPAVGFAPDPHKLAVRRGIEDVDAATRALARGVAASPPALSGSVDGWRRIGRILEASRLALAAPPGTAEAFFSSPWAAHELAHAARVLREAGVADAAWPDDARRRGPIDGDAAQKLLDRLDGLLGHVS